MGGGLYSLSDGNIYVVVHSGKRGAEGDGSLQNWKWRGWICLYPLNFRN